MIKIQITGAICPAGEWWGEHSFSVEDLRAALAADPDPDVLVDLDSQGGSVEEGLKIYDALRMSGRNIYTNIRGGCHSIAIVILLAAPRGNRSANRNVRALIHRVYTDMYGMVTAEDCADAAEMLAMEEEAILDIYADRTGRDREALRALMEQEHTHTAEELLEWGFIDKINDYTTNSLFKKMDKTQKSPLDAIRARLANYRKKYGVTVNFSYKDRDGKEVFTTETEEDDLKVGDTVTITSGDTLGEFILEDGRKVEIKDNTIISIETVEDDDDEVLAERVAELEELVSDLQGIVEKQEEQIRSLTGSVEKPETRRNLVPAKKDGKVSTDVANVKAELAKKIANLDAARKITK